MAFQCGRSWDQLKSTESPVNFVAFACPNRDATMFKICVFLPLTSDDTCVDAISPCLDEINGMFDRTAGHWPQTAMEIK